MKNLPPCLSSLPFAALFAYSPRGQSQISIQSRQVRDVVKSDRVWPGQDRPFIQQAIEKLQNELEEGRLAGFFGLDVGLVPVPRSAPLTKGALWPGLRICKEMVSLGLAGTILTCLERVEPVQKAAFATSSGASRPTVHRHLETVSCTRELLAPRRLLVTDDIVTSGSMLIAAASVLQASHPQATVMAFGLIRTMSTGDVDRILEPITGIISYDSGPYARRDP